MSRYAHPLPFGAEPQQDGTTLFRLWAPSVDAVTLERDGLPPLPMQAQPGGWFDLYCPAPAGTRYRYRLPDGLAVPDPASRQQAGDVHDASIVVDPRAYEWRNAGWQGRPWHEAVVYELHAGSMGGFAGIRRRLPELQALGITAIELMPVSDFPGGRNWGYDGVLPYAPDAAYGTPDELKALVDDAHGLGMMVMLDVVYNHFGPDGAYLHAYAKAFFDEDRQNPWGAAIDFKRPEVRDYFCQNAIYWLQEYRLDGLRFDAVHEIRDDGFLADMAVQARAAAGPGRHVHLVLEHENNRAALLRTGLDVPGYDAQWADDFHHCLHVLLTGEDEAYYADFQDATELLAQCLRNGFAYQGQVSPNLGRPRGEPSGHLPTTCFVAFLQNHDQIGNRAMGERLTTLADPAKLRAAMALLLLSPFIPMLFMGEEHGATTPFLFFTNHHDELAEAVRKGRRAEFKGFDAFKDERRRAMIPDPNALATFEMSVPVRDAPAVQGNDMGELVRGLLAARHGSIIPGLPGCRSDGVDVLGAGALRAAWRLGDGRRLVLTFNLGDVPVSMEPPVGAPLFAVPAGRSGSVLPPGSLVAYIEAA